MYNSRECMLPGRAELLRYETLDANLGAMLRRLDISDRLHYQLFASKDVIPVETPLYRFLKIADTCSTLHP